jgi:hypothetical protein
VAGQLLFCFKLKDFFIPATPNFIAFLALETVFEYFVLLLESELHEPG